MGVAAVDYCHDVALFWFLDGETALVHLWGPLALKVPAKE
jgi:hypothetical protein